MTIEDFIARWQGREGGQERANYAMFLTELCTTLGMEQPQPADNTHEANDYAFERAVRHVSRDGMVSFKRIDLYKRNGFILEAKQSRWSGEKMVESRQGQGRLNDVDEPGRGRRGAGKAWDVLMENARKQAEDYIRDLPADHDAPPFVLVCDVGHCIEVYANFRRDGRAFGQFPDRKHFRIYLEDLRDEAVRDRLRAIWLDPLSLDPSRQSARVTRDIAKRLAKVSMALERDNHPADDVAMFLMRVLFTMFAEDVQLLPKDSFQTLLSDCLNHPASFPHMLEDLWRAMDKGEFTATVKERVRRFNGEFFKDRRAFALAREDIAELLEAARHDWRDVDPAIFGTFLEQALDRDERKRLGAHYTPRAYVERLVMATIIDPLAAEFTTVLTTAERQYDEGRGPDAIATISAFHERLCKIRVLDPACGTGNFLYVSLALLKALEGEVLEKLVAFGGQEALTGLDQHSVDPHQFLGLEINPRAARIAELVLWIGYLQWHFRTRAGFPAEPIIRAFKNIECRDALLTWDGAPLPQVINGAEVLPNARRPDWPEADFIVGNPPFIGGKDLRDRLGSVYVETLWAVHRHMNASADFVMYWWDRAAELLTGKNTALIRFGFVTTNSITQVFQRKVIERHMAEKNPVSIVMAIGDHPWTKAGKEAAAVRIAMSVVQAAREGRDGEGSLLTVTQEAGLDTDMPEIEFSEARGKINSDFTVGVDVASTKAMISNTGLSSRGMALHGAGFIVTPSEARTLGLGRIEGLEQHIRHYRNGRDLMDRSRGVMVIDLFGLEANEVRRNYPEVYQHVLENVKPERDRNNEESRRLNWWLFGRKNTETRGFLVGIQRYIATVETAKHRVFQFLDRSILPDNKLVAIGLDDGFSLGILASSVHFKWYVANSAKIGMYEGDAVYVKSRCFDPFPFPACSELQKARIGAIAEELDALRKKVLADHAHLTLTGLYNVLEMLKAGAAPADLDQKHRAIFDDGLVLVLRELHQRLDVEVAAAYGWPVDLAEAEVLGRLVALNKERTAEEARGEVRWLRPEYQIPRFGTDLQKAEQSEFDLGQKPDGKTAAIRLVFSRDDSGQTAQVMAVLARSDHPLRPDEIASMFKQGKRAQPDIQSVLAALSRLGVARQSGKGYQLTG